MISVFDSGAYLVNGTEVILDSPQALTEEIGRASCRERV